MKPIYLFGQGLGIVAALASCWQHNLKGAFGGGLIFTIWYVFGYSWRTRRV